MKKLKNLNIFIFLSFGVSGFIFANVDTQIKNYQRHIDQVAILKKTAELYKLKTDVQKSKLECQKFGGCQSKSIYTPIETKKDNDSKKTKELIAVLNKPLPNVYSIYDNFVSFDNDDKRYMVGDIVYGVWLIESIKLTQVQVKSKDTNKSTILYFYWD